MSTPLDVSSKTLATAGLDLSRYDDAQLQKLDTTADGKIDASEMKAALALADRDGDGKVGPQELEAFDHLLGKNNSAEAKGAYTKLYGKPGQGSIAKQFKALSKSQAPKDAPAAQSSGGLGQMFRGLLDRVGIRASGIEHLPKVASEVVSARSRGEVADVDDATRKELAHGLLQIVGLAEPAPGERVSPELLQVRQGLQTLAGDLSRPQRAEFHDGTGDVDTAPGRVLKPGEIDTMGRNDFETHTHTGEDGTQVAQQQLAVGVAGSQSFSGETDAVAWNLRHLGTVKTDVVVQGGAQGDVVAEESFDPNAMRGSATLSGDAFQGGRVDTHADFAFDNGATGSADGHLAAGLQEQGTLSATAGVDGVKATGKAGVVAAAEAQATLRQEDASENGAPHLVRTATGTAYARANAEAGADC